MIHTFSLSFIYLFFITGFRKFCRINTKSTPSRNQQRNITQMFSSKGLNNNEWRVSWHWVTVYFGFETFWFDTRVSPTRIAFVLLSFFHRVINNSEARLEQRKAMSISVTAKCFRFGSGHLLTWEKTKQHIWEDQVQNQIILTHIRWIFKQRPLSHTQRSTSNWDYI